MAKEVGFDTQCSSRLLGDQVEDNAQIEVEDRTDHSRQTSGDDSDVVVKLSTRRLFSSPSGTNRIDAVIQRVRDRSLFRAWREKLEDVEALGTLDQAIEMFKTFETWITKEPQHMFYHLYSLEQRFTCAPEEAQEFIDVFSSKAEDMFGSTPLFVLKEFADDLIGLTQFEFGSQKASSRAWARVKRLGNRKGKEYDKVRAMQAQEEAAFVEELEVRISNMAKKESYRCSVPLTWLLNGFRRAVDNQRYTFLGIDEMKQFQARYSARALLPWTAVGYLARDLLLHDTMKAKDFMFDKTTILFQEFNNETTPAFVWKLTELRSLLGVQARKVEDLQSKMLAAMVTGGIGAVQAALRYLT